MWNENPNGIGHKWGLRPKKDRPKGWNHRKSSRLSRPGTSQPGFDWRATKDSKDEVEMAKKEHEKRMRAAFDSMDINHDGDLSKEEVKAAICFNKEVRELLELPDAASDEFDELYNSIDADQSNAVSYEEVRGGRAKRRVSITCF